MVTTDPDTGPVDCSTLVKGYAVEKNNYVLLSEEDFESVKLDTIKTLEIERFVDADTIDVSIGPILTFHLRNDLARRAAWHANLRRLIELTSPDGCGSLTAGCTSPPVANRVRSPHRAGCSQSCDPRRCQILQY